MGADLLPSLSFATRRELIERAAPLYREVSLAQKKVVLDQVITMTGYTRKYAIGLLNHLSDSKRQITRHRQPCYGSEVRHVLVLAWRAMNFLCIKRLIPFLPTLLPILERHGYLQLTEEHRSQVLQISTATAERLLHSQRSPTPRSLSLTQAGPLLKQQIPLRTFAQWDDAQPGFLEADLVGHHGGDIHGCFLYTLTLTDIATGWTECFPLLYKSPEAVLAAFQQARRRFPFPILGLDTDNGSEFINEAVMRYCEAEQLTFTRGRPEVKNDQCFVEQKNGAVVRQFVGNGRFVGSQALRQLHELYRALRLYVNCFQPSMKLISKQVEEGNVHRVYDPAKTPLQRLLLSGILPEATQHQLSEVAQALDPICLLRQVEHLQQALWRCVVTPFPLPSTASIVPFCVERCLPEGSLPEEQSAAPSSVSPLLQDAPQPEREMPDWSRTMRDPFEGKWDLICSLVLAHPEWSGRMLFQELQRLFPGSYQPSQLSTLQMGLRKIRAWSLEQGKEPDPQEVIQAEVVPPRAIQADQQQKERTSDPVGACAASVVHPHEEGDQSIEKGVSQEPLSSLVTEESGIGSKEGSQQAQESQFHCFTMTIESAIEGYLHAQKEAGRSQKTLEWHRIALGLLQQYLVEERQLRFLGQLTENELRGWVRFLRRPSSSVSGTTRKVSTVTTYGCSVRAFCHWAVSKGYLPQTPLVRGILPKTESKRIQVLEPDCFDLLLVACRPPGASGASCDRVAARNRSILWILLETGMHASELCGLRLSDVDQEQRSLRVGGKGHERWLPLSLNAWFQLCSYLQQCHPRRGASESEAAKEVPLFLSETYLPLTRNALTLLFARIRERAGVTEIAVNPLLLRDTFAVRFLQSGGASESLCALLGLKRKAALDRYEQLGMQKSKQESQQEPTEEYPVSVMTVSQRSERQRQRPPSVGRRSHQRRSVVRTHRIGKKKPASGAEEDP